MHTFPESFILVALALALPRPFPARESEDVPVAFTGRVLDGDGLPAAFVTVRTSAGGETLTDSSGTYWLEVVLPDPTRGVRVSAERESAYERATAGTWVGRTAAAAGVLVLEDLLLSSGCAPGWVPTFGAAPGTGGTFDGLLALCVFDDGGGNGEELYAAGRFADMNGITVANIARWNGTTWSDVGGGLGGSSLEVNALVVFDDGSGPALYAGGTFTVASGGPADYLARWDGTSWSAVPGGVSGLVRAMTVYDDGSGPALVVTGDFASAGGVPALHIARWDGTSWSALGSGSSGFLLALSVLDAGSGPELYVIGNYTSIGGVSANRVARWNGTSWSALGSGLNNVGFTGTVFDDGLGGGPELYVSGSFTTAGGVAADGIARWDGTSWSSVGVVSADNIYSLVVFDDGSGPALYTTGNFAGNARTAKWDGTSWSFLGSASGYSDALAVYDEGAGPALFRAGQFFIPAHNIARWDGARWVPVGAAAPNSSVDALLVYDDGGGPALIVGGGFSHAGGELVNYVARWDGSQWSKLGDGLSHYLQALEVFDAGSGPELYAGARYVGGPTTTSVSRWDGSSWSAVGTTPSATITALLSFDDGSGPGLYAGGLTFPGGGTTQAYVARWNGSSWTTLTGVTPGSTSVQALCVYDDGAGGGPRLVAGGEFFMGGGRAVATWNGASWSAIPGLPAIRVQALAVFDHGTGPELYIGGFFAPKYGAPWDYVARWDGSTWSSLGSGTNGQIYELKVLDDGRGPALYVGGWFDEAGGTSALGLGRWDGESWSTLAGGPGTIQALLDGDALGRPRAIFAGGAFRRALGSGDGNVALWEGCDTYPPVLSLPPFVAAKDPLPGPRGEIVHFTVTATDNTDPAPVVVCAPPSGSFFPQGPTEVTCTATDADGNSSTGSFTVFVGKVRPR